MKIASTNKKIREIIGMVKENKLIPRPEFQRRLVWTHKDKDLFLDSILRGYPFPEIYIADGEVDLESGAGTQLLVDGLQRVNTIIEYFEASANLRLLSVPPYKDLKEDDKRSFLQYDVTVRDLGSVKRNELVEVFKRINATKYSLLDIEVNNAVYNGALKNYSERLAEDKFFIDHGAFNARDFKRMGDLSYALTIVITLISGYFNRDDSFGELLGRYNDEFPLEKEIDLRLRDVFNIIEECGFDKISRIWKKADLFTVIVELDMLKRKKIEWPQPTKLIRILDGFYKRIDTSGIEGIDLPGIYYKSAIQATNDKVSRLRRGVIIGGLLEEKTEDEIIGQLKSDGLFPE